VEERDGALGAALRAAVGGLAEEGVRRSFEAMALDLAAHASAREPATEMSPRPVFHVHGSIGARFLAAAALAVVAGSALGFPALAARRRAFDAGLDAACSILPEASTWVADAFLADFRPDGAVDEFVAGLWSQKGLGPAAGDAWGESGGL